MINKTIENERIHSSAAAKVSHELRAYGVNLRSGFQFPNLFSWLSSPFNLPHNFLLILLAIATAYLFYCVRALGTALMLLQRPQMVAAQTLSIEEQLEQFLKNRQTTTTSRPLISLPDYRPTISPDFHIIQLFIFLALLAIFAYFLW
jgi:ABC-type transport system involved in multi-copper enzyme maturation permease subunit